MRPSTLRGPLRWIRTYIPSYHNLAIAHLEAGRYPQAVEAAETALRFDPQSPSSYRLLAFLHKEQGQYERAEEAPAEGALHRPKRRGSAAGSSLALQPAGSQCTRGRGFSGSG